MRRVPAVVLLGIVVGSGAAAAETRANVAVVPAGEAENRTVVAAVWALRAAVDEHAGLKAVAVSERLADAPLDPSEEGRAALAEGRQAFTELDLERAARALESAARLLATVENERDGAIESLDLLAQTRSAAHDELGAALAYLRLMRLDPTFRPDTEAAGPSLAKAWKRAKTLKDAGERASVGSLRIESISAPAAVFGSGVPSPSPMNIFCCPCHWLPWRPRISFSSARACGAKIKKRCGV